MGYVAKYWRVDGGMMLGGVRKGVSCVFSHKQDAMDRLQAAIDVHKDLPRPCEVIGVVEKTTAKAEIVRHCQTAQAVGGRCPECGEVVK